MQIRVLSKFFQDPLPFACWTVAVNPFHVLGGQIFPQQVGLYKIQCPRPTCEDDTGFGQPCLFVGLGEFLTFWSSIRPLGRRS